MYDTKEPLDVNMKRIPKSARRIYRLLQNSRILMDTPAIQLEVEYSTRTTRKGLKILTDMGIVESKRSLSDARKVYYQAAGRRHVFRDMVQEEYFLEKQMN